MGGRSAPSLSTRDDTPLAVLKKGLEKRQSAADKVINMAQEALAATPVLPQDDGEVKYVLDMSDSLRSAIAEGRIKLDTAHGDPVAQIRRADGTLGEKIHVKEELVEKGVDPAELAVAMQLKSIQDKLEEITAALEEIGDGVRGRERPAKRSPWPVPIWQVPIPRSVVVVRPQPFQPAQGAIAEGAQ